MQANTQIGWNVNFSNREISLATERQVDAIISYKQRSNTKIPLDLNNYFGCLNLTTCATKTDSWAFVSQVKVNTSKQTQTQTCVTKTDSWAFVSQVQARSTSRSLLIAW